MKIIKQAAEAIIYRNNDIVIKERIKKGYRIKYIDDKLRKSRTRREAKLLEKVDNAPKVFSVNDKKMTIEMEFIDGKLIKDILDKAKNRNELLKEIGQSIAKMHDDNIIHGDLTTSNMILKDKVYFIDFGLGFVSHKIEDKAVDLHLLKQALESKHYLHFEESFKSVLEGYKTSKNSKDVVERLKSVEKRGRYKRKNE
jgi:TP53 regulating kinase-like protein